jgi:hypothetical protein
VCRALLPIGEGDQVLIFEFNLFIKTAEENISAGMPQLNGVSNQPFHKLHGSSRHVIQGHFKSILVVKDSYLLQLCRSILLNPF